MHTQDNVVNWIGQIPGHWRLQRIKSSIESVINGVWGEEPANDGNDTICVRVADFNRTTYGVEMDNPTFRKIDRKDLKNRCLRPGDLLIEKSGGSGDLNPVGFVVRYTDNQPAVCSNFIARIRLKPCADSNYFKYLFAAAYNTGINKKSIKQTTGIQNLDTESYFSEKVPFPPLEDQKVIAAFLDQQTAKLDQLVEKKQRLIHLLQEKRQALITQAVTKGLDPNVPMKDSGIEWLGKVPAHWKIMKLTRIFRGIGSGTTPDSNEIAYYDGDIPWVITGDLNDGELHETSKHITKTALSNYSSLKLYPPGTLLIAMYGASIGKLAILQTSAATNQACCALYSPKDVDTKFVFYWLMANRKHIVSLALGGGQPNISQDIIRNLRICFPPIDEQNAILKHIDDKTKKIDKVVKKLEKQVELINEYRQALITAAVTGQIDVLREKLAVSADPIPAGKE